MSDNYIDMMNKLARKKQLKQSKAMLKQILRVYESTMKQYMREWVNASKKHGPNGTASIKLKYAYMAQLHAKILAIQEEYGIKASTTYNDLAVALFGDERAFKETLKYDEFSKLLGDIADIGNQEYLEMMYSGSIYKDGKGLSERLWQAVSVSGDRMQDEIMKCISQGMVSKDAYKHLVQFSIGGNAAYNAMRLARTTYCHMSQLSAINAQKLNPYIGGIKWHSVHAVGRTCDECKDRDGKIYKPKELPFDHPNGMCYMEEVLMIDGKEATPAEIAKDLKKWLKGEPNSGIMEKWYKQSKDDVKVPKNTAEKVRKVTKATKKTVAKK